MTTRGDTYADKELLMRISYFYDKSMTIKTRLETRRLIEFARVLKFATNEIERNTLRELLI